eukprot:90137-Pleurochrysis_carterae.AAC.1
MGRSAARLAASEGSGASLAAARAGTSGSPACNVSCMGASCEAEATAGASRSVGSGAAPGAAAI